MEPQTELIGLIRRSSSISCDQLLFLLYIFEERCRFSTETDRKDYDNLSFEDIALILQYSFPGLAPRFLFALSTNNTLLRSSDRGLSWKMVYKQDFDSAVCVPEEHNNVTDDVLMDLIKGLNPEETDLDAVLSTKYGKDHLTLSCISNYSECVALAGKEGFLAVSIDNGMTFTTSKNYLKPILGSESDVSYIAIVDANCILAAGGSTVFKVRISPAVFNKASLDGSTVILKCKSSVCALEVMRYSSSCLHIIVAEEGWIHLSWNNGSDFISIPHKLGRIRSLDALCALRNCEMPMFPESSMVSYLRRSKGIPLAECSQESYEYSCGNTVEATGHFALEELKAGRRVTSRRFGNDSNIFFWNFLAVGNGTEVLSYDYSGMLCLCISISGDFITTFSHASSVNYVPLSCSSLNDSMSCLSMVVAPERALFVRACSCGVSTSWDLKKWSDLQFSAPVGVFALDGNELVVCIQRNTTFIMRCNDFTIINSGIASGNFRVHSLKRASILY